MGGAVDRFRTTRWTEIQQVGALDPTGKRVAINHLIERYWKPVYTYLRHKGHQNDTAKDLTQGFFQDVVLEKALFSRADPQRGRFRTYLLTALDRYVVDCHRHETARKRQPLAGIASIEADDLPMLPADSQAVTPDHAFHYAWATQLLDEAFARLRRECEREEKLLHWRVFHKKVMLPILEGQPAPAMKDLCKQLGIASESQASNMIVTIKRRFRGLLMDLLAESVGTDVEAEEEFSELIRILGSPCAES